MNRVTTGELWVDKEYWEKSLGNPPFSASWKVVSITSEQVGLSGPGPCRSYKVELIDEFFKNYRKLSDG